MKYLTFLEEQAKRAEKQGLEKEAIQLLVRELLNLKKADFILKLHDPIESKEIKRLTKAIDKYIMDKYPVQYILGYTYFYGYKINVNKNVLIPRPETEELINYVLHYYNQEFLNQDVDVVDIGTGSGAIAIALSKENKHMNVFATDISKKALDVAIENAKNNNAKINFLKGDMLSPLIRKELKFDMLISNPPYIPQNDYVEDIVKNNEPNIALFGGNDGMKYYEIILSSASKVLKKKNLIAFEHGYNSKEKLIKLKNKYFPDGELICIKDLNNKERIMIIINR